MSDQDNTFEKGDAGSSGCTPWSVGDLKKGGYVLIKDHPCKISEYSTAKPGKHGSAKATIVGLDIFTGKKYEDTAPTGATMSVPDVFKEEYEVADIDDDHFVSVILDDGSLKTDLKLPEADQETFDELKKVYDENHSHSSVLFTIQRSCGVQKFISARTK